MGSERTAITHAGASGRSVPIWHAMGATRTPNINVETNPFGFVVNPVTNKIYVANSPNNTVTAIDGTTNMTTTISVGTYPYNLAVNPLPTS